MSFLETYARYPITLVRGDGVRLLDDLGRWYLDGISGIAVMPLGHNHPRVTAAVHAQVDRLFHTSNLFSVDVQRAFADALSAAYAGPEGAARVFLSNSGAEANEGAVKLARKHHARLGDPRAEVITLQGAFHGRTLLTLAMTPKPAYQADFGPLPAEVRSVAVAEAAEAVTERTAAIFVEPVQGEGGCVPVPLEVRLAIRAACDRTGALLVYDEIQCGLGRTGVFTHDPRPDVVTLAKALGGGLPLGAVVAHAGLGQAFRPGDHGSTFGGNPVACAAGLATLQIIEEDGLVERCAALGARLAEGLAATGARVTGDGLMRAAWVDQPAGVIVDRMRERGALVCPAGANAVRFLPPYICTEVEIDELVAAFAGALASEAA